MRIEAVLRLSGLACTLLAVALCVPLAACLLSGADPALTRAFVLSTTLSLSLGLGLRFAFTEEPDPESVAEPFAAMTLSWLLCALLGALPFVLSGHIASPLDACFEALSGLTASGATLLRDPAVLPPPLLLWRALLQFAGCMGFLSVCVAVLARLGSGGNFFFAAKEPGAREALPSHLRTAARRIQLLLVLILLVEGGALWLAGMSPFDALCHALSTSSAGGFSTRADGLSGFPAAVQWTAVACMVVAGLNVVLLAAALRGRPARILRDAETRAFLALLAVSALALLWLQASSRPPLQAARHALFAAASAISGSSLRLDDAPAVPVSAQALLLLLIGCGACTASPSSGLRLRRVLAAGASAWRRRARAPWADATTPLRIAGREADASTAARATRFVVLYLLVLAGAAALFLLLGLDLREALGTSLGALANAAEGTHGPGCATRWADLPAQGRLLAMILMLVGRLEVCAALVLLLPRTRRR